ncbi:MAG: hypothetical protein U9N56_03220, partial [Actinomycetota bacterium]|nr:hypothetical protein [Actinomycetota bacterium]
LVSRSHTLRTSTASTSALTNLGGELLRRALQVADGDPVTLIGMSVSNLTTDTAVQMELDIDEGDVLRTGSAADTKRRMLDKQVDALRERFGKDLLRYGTSGRGIDDDFRRLAEKP